MAAMDLFDALGILVVVIIALLIAKLRNPDS